MGVSLYFTARRPASLSSDEQRLVEYVLDEYNQTAPLLEGELLSVYSVEGAAEILSGAMQLPLGDVAPEELQELIDHWLAGISALRNVIPDAKWDVRLDDLELPWFGGQTGYQLHAW